MTPVTLAESFTLSVNTSALATVAGADRIVVLERGRVEAQGTHAQLQECSPLYRRFCALQLEPAGGETLGEAAAGVSQ